jgi:hypothetical protein
VAELQEMDDEASELARGGAKVGSRQALHLLDQVLQVDLHVRPGLDEAAQGVRLATRPGVEVGLVELSRAHRRHP